MKIGQNDHNRVRERKIAAVLYVFILISIVFGAFIAISSKKTIEDATERSKEKVQLINE